ncbi:hypothetical protein D1872_316470 [compost metagenome]
MVSKIAPTEPKAADSVGVAIPAKIEPRTSRISSAGAKIALSASTITVLRGKSLAIGGARCGLARVNIRI